MANDKDPASRLRFAFDSLHLAVTLTLLMLVLHLHTGGAPLRGQSEGGTPSGDLGHHLAQVGPCVAPQRALQ